ncbi:MAG: 5'/3'-nucleotidase SurE [Bacteroidetes bacterium]|nr:5'/3'-nucleotidase SurE [Bacteroidota bacterium]
MKKKVTKNKSQRNISILVTNDDGIDAQGIAALVKELKKIATVTVVAPDKQQSAVGHAITMNYPLRVKEYYKNGKFFGYAVQGTPADCVKIAVRALLPEEPDLIVSGINHGSNTAISVIYSGTVSAATEGTVLGIPSIAVSLTTYKPSPDFSYAARIARKLSLLVLKQGLPRRTLLNVNVPALPKSEIKGVLVTKQSSALWNDTFDHRRDPGGVDYYWLTGVLDNPDTDITYDEAAIRQGYVSITPIHYDLTDYETYEVLQRWPIHTLK